MIRLIALCLTVALPAAAAEQLAPPDRLESATGVDLMVGCLRRLGERSVRGGY